MSFTASEVALLQKLLKIMGLQQQRMPLLLCDNLSAVCLSANPMFHKCMKHFEVDFHYGRERVAMKLIEVKHIPSSLQLAGSQAVFQSLRSKLSVSLHSTLSLRGCNGSMSSECEGKAHVEETQVEPTQVSPSTVKTSSSQTTRRTSTPKVAHRTGHPMTMIGFSYL